MGMLVLRGLRLLVHVLPHNCAVFMELARSVHLFDIILNCRVVITMLGVVGEVLKVSEAMRVATHSVVLVPVHFVEVFLVGHHVILVNHLVLVFVCHEAFPVKLLLSLFVSVLRDRFSVELDLNFAQLFPH